MANARGGEKHQLVKGEGRKGDMTKKKLIGNRDSQTTHIFFINIGAKKVACVLSDQIGKAFDRSLFLLSS